MVDMGQDADLEAVSCKFLHRRKNELQRTFRTSSECLCRLASFSGVTTGMMPTLSVSPASDEKANQWTESLYAIDHDIKYEGNVDPACELAKMSV